MALGFVINNNLNEMDTRNKDVLSLNNLGGDGTAQNLSLFINNTRNESVLKAERFFSIINATYDPSTGFLRFVFDEDIDFLSGRLVTISGVNPAQYNLVNARIAIAEKNSITIFYQAGLTLPPYTPLQLAPETVNFEEFFDTDGVTNNFTLSLASIDAKNLLVSIDGVTQSTSAYSLSASALTFSEVLSEGKRIRVLHFNHLIDEINDEDIFDADGQNNLFTLSHTTLKEENVLVSIDGVIQTTDSYTLLTGATSTLRFSEVLPEGSRVRALNLKKLEESGNTEDILIADGVTRSFTLSQIPFKEEDILVSIDGILQSTSSYQVTGSTLLLTELLPVGSRIRVLHLNQSLDLDEPSGGIATSRDYFIQQNEAGEDIVFRGNLEQVVFSNNTPIIHDDLEYNVVNSNGLDSFQLEDAQGNKFTPTKDLIRKDEITFDNIVNLYPQVLQPISTNNNRGNQEDSDNAFQISPIVDNDDITPLIDAYTLQDLFVSTNASIDAYSFRRSISVVTNDPINFDRTYNTDASITVENTENIPLNDEGSPGIFIYNGTDSIRAFSDNSNPWSNTTPGSGYTETQASVATVRKLEITRPNFESLSVNSDSGNLFTFTHKVPLRVEDGTGERTYFLLASLD